MLDREKPSRHANHKVTIRRLQKNVIVVQNYFGEKLHVAMPIITKSRILSIYFCYKLRDIFTELGPHRHAYTENRGRVTDALHHAIVFHTVHLQLPAVYSIHV